MKISCSIPTTSLNILTAMTSFPQHLLLPVLMSSVPFRIGLGISKFSMVHGETGFSSAFLFENLLICIEISNSCVLFENCSHCHQVSAIYVKTLCSLFIPN